MGPRHGRGPGGPRTANGRPGLPAYGNNTTWRDDDFRVAVIILLVATAWIILAFRKRKNGNKGWFDGLGFGFGPAAAPSFSRQAKGTLVLDLQQRLLIARFAGSCLREPFQAPKQRWGSG